MDKIDWQRTIFLGALGMGLLTVSYGCGGGGGGSSAPANPVAATNPGASQPVAVTSTGVITGFSSVFVNGVKHEVESDTAIAVEGSDDMFGDDSALRIGMKVRIAAIEDGAGRRVAQRIEFDEDLKGPARNVTPNAADPRFGTFLALGQTVFVDANTVFDDDVGDNNGDGTIDIRDLVVANGEVVVEVSGLVGDDGIVATRIDRVNGPAGVPGNDDDEFEVKGVVDTVAADGSRFTINGTAFLVVSGGGGTVFDDNLRADDELVGVFVEVKADETDTGELLAVRVEREDDIGDVNGDGVIDSNDRTGRIEIEGILVAVDVSVAPNIVVIGGTTLSVDDAGVLIGREGNRVELKGRFDDDGVLVLDQAKLEVENTVRTEDRVAQVDLNAGTLTTRLGLVITPTGDSRIGDDVDDDDHLTPAAFLERVQTGDFIEARGFPNADGSVTWRRVERDDEDDQRCELRGPVTSISDGATAASFGFEIQGVRIDVDLINSDSNFGAGGRQRFFDQLNVGDVVKAESDEQGLGCENGLLTAREVEFEHGDDVFGTIDDNDNDNNEINDNDNDNNDINDNDNDNDNNDNELTGTPQNIGDSSFALNGRTIRVVASTLIDDSLIELALGQEFDGDDQRFDQLPGGLTLADVLPGTFAIIVVVDSDGVALRIEDL